VKVFKATIRLDRIGARFSWVLSESGLAALRESIRRRQLGPAHIECVEGPFDDEHEPELARNAGLDVATSPAA